jgi:3-methyladenine DNA glycosylase Mpg
MEGKKFMLKRIGVDQITKEMGVGPGKVSKLLGIDYRFSGLSLVPKNKCEFNQKQDKIYIEDNQNSNSNICVNKTTRIGIAYAMKDAMLPYRFIYKL